MVAIFIPVVTQLTLCIFHDVLLLQVGSAVDVLAEQQPGEELHPWRSPAQTPRTRRGAPVASMMFLYAGPARIVSPGIAIKLKHAGHVGRTVAGHQPILGLTGARPAPWRRQPPRCSC